MTERIIIIGATSGIGEALARRYIDRGGIVGITGRRTEKLQVLQELVPDRIHIQTMDVTDYETSRKLLLELIEKMGGVDILIVNAGIGDSIPVIEKEITIINTNVTGFVNMMRSGLDYMKVNGGGKLVGISSVAGARGFRIMTVYGASKRFITHYMEGLRHFISRAKLPIKVIDIRPGFIETPLTEGNDLLFWQIPVDKAVDKMIRVIDKGKIVAYIPSRWKYIYNLWRVLPRWISYRL